MTLEPSSSHSRSSTPLPRPAVSRNLDGETHGSERDSPERQVQIIKSNKLTRDKKEGLRQRSQRPLPAEVARRAFECVVDTHGVMSQVVVLDPTKQAAAKRYGDHGTEAINTVGRGHPLRGAHGQPASATYRLGALRFGAEFNLGDRQVQVVGDWDMLILKGVTSKSKKSFTSSLVSEWIHSPRASSCLSLTTTYCVRQS